MISKDTIVKMTDQLLQGYNDEIELFPYLNPGIKFDGVLVGWFKSLRVGGEAKVEDGLVLLILLNEISCFYLCSARRPYRSMFSQMNGLVVIQDEL